MTTRHTPGPWETSVTSDGEVYDVCREGGGDMICDLACNRNGKNDARLIAAAPIMLEALQHVETNLAGQSEETFEHELAHIRYAITRATGRERG